MSYENPMGDGDAVTLTIEAEHGRFLRSLFTMARDGIKTELAEHPDQLREPQRLRGEEAVYDKLLTSLDRGLIEPSGEIRRVLDELARAVDAANEYERVVAEHDALVGLIRQLGGMLGEEGA